jgi:hypothetical protein
LDGAPSNVKQASGPSMQANKQTRTTKNKYTKQKESFKRAYKRIELFAAVMRAQETRKTELEFKRNSYRKIYVIKENKEIMSFIYFNLEN